MVEERDIGEIHNSNYQSVPGPLGTTDSLAGATGVPHPQSRFEGFLAPAARQQ